MPEEKDITYKNLYFKFHSGYQYLEILIDDQNFSDMKTYVTSISVLLEYALTVRPRYILVNKLETDFEVGKELYQFTKKNIFAPLIGEGVQKFICLVKAAAYHELYKDIERNEPFVKGFTSKQEAIQWIVENS